MPAWKGAVFVGHYIWWPLLPLHNSILLRFRRSCLPRPHVRHIRARFFGIRSHPAKFFPTFSHHPFSSFAQSGAQDVVPRFFILREIALRPYAGGGKGGGSGGEGRGRWGRNWGRFCCGVGQSGIKWRHRLRNARITTNKGGVHGWAQWRISS